MKNYILIISLLITWVGIVSAQDKDLIFSHKFHIEDVEAACTDCHEPAGESTTPSDNLLPAMETCYNCHDEDDTECSLCHVDPDNAGEVARIADLKTNFSHKVHIDAETKCVTCHVGIEEKEEPTSGTHIPTRTACTDCHGAADALTQETVCRTCHGESIVLKPADHTVQWSKEHGLTWQIDENSCNHCHLSNESCTDCHQGDNLDNEVHPMNFRNTHGIKAKANKENCQTCHQDLQFCNDCHRIEMVMPRNHSYAGWSNTTTGGQHARAAQYDFDYCRSCHTDVNADVVCTQCHGR